MWCLDSNNKDFPEDLTVRALPLILGYSRFNSENPISTRERYFHQLNTAK